MKRGVLLIALFLLVSISFASAASLSDLLNQIDESALILFAVFIIAFAVLFFSLNRVFKGNNTTSGIVSVALALLITYGVNKTGLDFGGFFLNVGISEEILATALPIVILAGIVLMVIKLAKNSLLVIGGLLILASFFVYSQITLIVIGIILIVLRFTVFVKSGVWEPKKKGGGSGQIVINR